MAVPLNPYTSQQIQAALVALLEAGLVDPYEQKTGNTRTNFVNGEDFKLLPVNTTPVINIDVDEEESSKVTSQKTNYVEEERHDFIIYYYCDKDKTFTFPTGAGYSTSALKGKQQAREFMLYIRNTIKASLGSMTYAHKVNFGVIPEPKWNPKTALFVSMMPMSVTTYRR